MGPATSAAARPSASVASRRPSRPPTGSRTHVIDRATQYVALHDQGLSPAAIARRQRKSRGYVSIVLRLGLALRGLPPEEIAAFRHPRITFKLAQRLVRDAVATPELRRQLRLALGGFSTHNMDGRRRRGDRAKAGSGAPARPSLPPWGWDATAFAAGPLDFVSAHVDALLRLHGSIETAAIRALSPVSPTASASALHGATTLRSLQRLLAHRQTAADAVGPAASGDDPDARLAVRLMGDIRRQLDELRGAVERVRRQAPETVRPRAPDRSSTARPPVTDEFALREEIERDTTD